MDKIHPATYILWLLLMASIATNFVQSSQIKRLERIIGKDKDQLLNKKGF